MSPEPKLFGMIIASRTIETANAIGGATSAQNQSEGRTRTAVYPQAAMYSETSAQAGPPTSSRSNSAPSTQAVVSSSDTPRPVSGPRPSEPGAREPERGAGRAAAGAG